MTHKGRMLATVICGALALGGTAMAEGTGTTVTDAAAGMPSTDAVFARLAEITQRGALVQIVATEGTRHGLGLEDALFPGRGGADWKRLVGRIQAADRLHDMMAETFRTAMRPADLSAVEAFFASDLGRKVAAREVTSRRLMLDSDVEAGAMRASATLAKRDDARAALIDGLIESLDLVTANVSGGLNANFAFYKGLGEGGALKKRMTESEMLAMVWGQEEQIRQATRAWLRAHLTLAYAPLSDAELGDYAAFMATPEGRRYSSAMFEGFGAVFETTSYELGRAAAEFMLRQDA